jgi:hypothetical protein
MRDRWFSSTIFKDNKRAKDYLKNHPSTAERLAILTTGVIVGRGLTLTLHFKDVSDVQEWGSSTTSGGGGINLFGYQLGGGGGGSSSYNHHVINTKEQTVTFKDDETVCRLVGLRATPVNPDLLFEDVSYFSREIWEIPELQQEVLDQIRRGNIPDKAAIIEKIRKMRGGGG